MDELSISETEAPVAVRFSGSRGELFRQLLAGYLLMVPTLGLYRFWLTTGKRRFYWMHTAIGEDALEYSGTAVQLLVGFLFALAFFVPLYAGFFFLSTQPGPVALGGYIAAGAVLWFLSGYAIFRGRDFRLSRTLWRGIRFGQEGNAWGYALRRFLWSLLVAVTLGLAYPFMAADLWRYRYTHTRFGDRAFSFTGSWKTVAGPFYKAYAAAVIAAIVWAVSLRAGPGALFFASLLLAAVIGLGFLYYRSRETSRMYSSVRLGDAELRVSVQARGLFAQYVFYALALVGWLIGLGILAAILYGVFSGALPQGFDTRQLARSGWVGLSAIAAGYFALFASFSLMSEVFLDCGFWMLVARGAEIKGLASLESVKGSGEDRSLVGEGLADALNVGSF